MPALGGYWFTRTEREATEAAAELGAEEAALQAYPGQMGQLLLDKDRPLRKPNTDSEAMLLARAWTLTVLARLTGPGKGRVVQFSYESNLINPGHSVIDPGGADLSGADLSATYLRDVILVGASLRGADLSGAVVAQELRDAAHLEGATLPNGRKYEGHQPSPPLSLRGRQGLAGDSALEALHSSPLF